MKQYAQNSWNGASEDARKAYARGAKSFEEYYEKAPKEIPNLRYDGGGRHSNNLNCCILLDIQ